MNQHDDQRPDPDALLSALSKEEGHSGRGKLKIFFGMCAGAGKTYEMLKAAREAMAKRNDVIVGYVETHNRPETEALLVGLNTMPRKRIGYRGVELEEMDLDGALAARPQLILVDELAHTNAPGSRHAKRYQDVLELLENGIDVYTTLNVQHLESRAETVAQIAGAPVRETVPDSIFEQADEIEVIDISPEDLLKRLAEGKVYTADRSQQAIQNFFRKGNLTALREMALRLTAERVDHQLRDYMKSQRITETWKSGQRLIVGISPSRSSISLIRWARRMAYTMNATWVGVYVETSKTLTEKAKLQLLENIKLARQLGAEIQTTADDDVAKALLRVARQQNATQILVGKTREGLPFAKGLVHRIIAKSTDVDVYVVGEHDEQSPHSHYFGALRPSATVRQYGIATLAVLGVALVCFPFLPYIGYETVALILLMTVTLLPLRLGVGPVLLAATLSALVWDFFFIAPQFTFNIALPQDILLAVTYFIIASVTGVLTARIRAREKAVRQREEHASALFTLTKELTAAKTQDEVAEIAVRTFGNFFNADVAVFLSQADGDVFTRAHPSMKYEVDEKELSVAAWVYWNEQKAGRYTDTLALAQATYYPLSGPRYPLGVIGVRHRGDDRLSIDQESLLQNFIAQIAATLEREQLNEIAKQTVVHVESERLYKTLFNSISHELRTPIAAILSATEGLASVEAHDGVKKELLGEIHTGAERLNRLVENLLDMARLESGTIQPKLDWCDIRDLIGTAVRKLAGGLQAYPLVLHVADDIRLLRLDHVLIEQALTNILHNATLYTPPGTAIDIRAENEANGVKIVIQDHGPGFPPEALEKLFEKFYRIPGSQVGGTGLGLSIARGFVEAHRGSIRASNADGGGARFEIRLPLHMDREGS
jgi:two-component system sensor histidine kinase KdpD